MYHTIHCIALDKICHPNSEGDLGIWKMEDTNAAFQLTKDENFSLA